MNKNSKQISNPASTGGLGVHFENRVQTAFSILMLADGFSPCLPTWPIVKIKLQGKYQDFETDDLIVFCKDQNSDRQAKLIGQIKHSIKITRGDVVFGEVVQAAWEDFNNKKIFSISSGDAFALICGPLSATDTYDVRFLLEQARYAESSGDFFNRIEQAKFTSNEQREKLEVFKVHLQKANGNVSLKDDELWSFLKSFHLLIYDLDIKGVTLSLLHTLIEQYSRSNANAIWAQVKDQVEWVSENAGSITISSMPEEIRTAFKKIPVKTIPEAFVVDTAEVVFKDWNFHASAPALSIASFIGSWNEGFAPDKLVASQIGKEEFSSWVPKLRETLQTTGSPIVFKNGVWNVKDRISLWKMLGPRIFDDNLDIFKKCAVEVLTERDPKFDLEKNDRFAASMLGKVLKYSKNLRKGLAETLALLGCFPKALKNCSLGKAEHISTSAVREIFTNADWVIWASLGELLPTLAEASPDEFLKAVEAALGSKPCPFDGLFAQEGGGPVGWNYTSGLLWALETLAWEETYLVRVVNILGDLAARDPGGSWSNRPSNSISTILMPWNPQTIASKDKRKVAIKTLVRDLPDVGWKALLSLLPNHHQISMGSCKPKFRDFVPKEWTGKVTGKEYWELVFWYSEFAVEIAGDNIARLNVLITNLDNLPKDAFEALLAHLSSDSITSMPEETTISLWNALVEFTAKHKRHSDAKWALQADLVAKIDKVATKLQPKNPSNLYTRLFNGRDFDLYEKDEEWEDQQKRLDDRRQKALREIISAGGIDEVLRLLIRVDSPSSLGFTLGSVGDDLIDSRILPSFLDSEDTKRKQFLSAYVWSKYHLNGWAWVEKIVTNNWSKGQIAGLHMFLPFTMETWKRVNAALGESESLYWEHTSVNPFQVVGDISIAIDKLIQFGRPYAALDCVYKGIHDKKPIDLPRIVRALISAISSKEPLHSIDTYHITEIIKVLQNDDNVVPGDLFQIEWAYLPLLDGYNGTRPKYLETRLSTDPEFFCEIIQLLFRSKNVPKVDKEPTEHEKVIATNAWHLLHKWSKPPGIQKDGTFDKKIFSKWLKESWEACDKSGHLEIALSQIGKVLFYSPADPSGLWIDKTVAEALNGKDTDEMRNGFRTEVFNSRGVYNVDPTGKPEKEIAEKWRQRADEVENSGYQRFASALRELAKSYDREAERNIDMRNPESEI
jgi:hypothetical protein